MTEGIWRRDLDHARSALAGSRQPATGGGYRYRGTGKDTLTPPAVMRSWGYQVRALTGNPGPAADDEQAAETERAIAVGRIAVPVTALPAACPGLAPTRRGSLATLDELIGVLAGLFDEPEEPEVPAQVAPCPWLADLNEVIAVLADALLADELAEAA